MLAECGAKATGDGLIADAKLVAKEVGLPFTTLRKTVEALAAQFGLDLEATEATTRGGPKNDDDDWEARMIAANAEASAFAEDDSFARQLLLERNRWSPPPGGDQGEKKEEHTS